MDDDSKYFMILGSHYWAILVWDLVEIPSGDGRLRIFRLEGEGCNFQFVYSLTMWRAAPCAIKWHEGGEGIVIQKIGADEDLVVNCLRFSNKFTYNDLVQLAIHCGLAGVKNKSRRDILTLLATRLVDEDFAAMVLEQDLKASKGPISNGALIQCLYENLDSDEKGDFGNMKEAVDKSQKAAVQKKWQKLLKDKTDETKATQFALGVVSVSVF